MFGFSFAVRYKLPHKVVVSVVIRRPGAHSDTQCAHFGFEVTLHLVGLFLRPNAFGLAVPRTAGMARKVNTASWLHHRPAGIYIYIYSFCLLIDFPYGGLQVSTPGTRECRAKKAWCSFESSLCSLGFEMSLHLYSGLSLHKAKCTRPGCLKSSWNGHEGEY